MRGVSNYIQEVFMYGRLRTCVNSLLSATTSEKKTLELDEIVVAIVDAVSDAEGVSPLELQPLTTVIDPDALSALFRDRRNAMTVEFHYRGYRIRVSSDSHVTVEVF